jgi:hypothetical protein
MPSTLNPLIAGLAGALADRDYAAFRQRMAELGARARECEPDDLTAALGELAPMLGRSHGMFAKVAVLAAACVEWGGSPLPLRDALPDRAAWAMELYSLFPAAWAQAADGQPLPDRADPPPMARIVDTLVADAARRGNPETYAIPLALTWFDIEDWVEPMVTVMARRDFRAAMAHRDRIREAAAALAPGLDSARWLHGLSVVLDDEPLVVLDHASGRGFRLTMSGIGDNFQLHTLLADRLIAPGLLDGDPPEPAWVAAATDGPVRLQEASPIVRRFRLFDGHGHDVSPDGRPAGIEPLDGTRVLVLHPPLAPYGWTNGRAYQRMPPSLTLDHPLDPAEAATWRSRIAPPLQASLNGKASGPSSDQDSSRGCSGA